MKTILLATLVCICDTAVVNAQDNNTLAQNSYTQAEMYYANGDSEHAIAKLDEAERLLGEPKSKLVYLRVKIFYDKFSKNSQLYSPLKAAIDTFIKITDKETYPAEKYSDVLLIQAEAERFIIEDELTSKRLLSGGSIESIDAYLKKAPNTFYWSKLSTKLSELRTQKYLADAEQQKIRQQSQERIRVMNRLTEVEVDLREAKKKGTRRRVLGFIGFFGGGALAIYGATLEEPLPEDPDNTGPRILSMALGGTACIMGAFGLFGGNHREVKELKEERASLLKDQEKFE